MKRFIIILVLLVAVFGLLVLARNLRSPELEETSMSALSLSSPAFEHGGFIPLKYTCDAESPVSPELRFEHIRENTKTLALIVDDPDVPKEIRPSGVFDHWVLFNIPVTVSGILEGGTAGMAGVNGRNLPEYAPPCPPPQYEPAEHRYVFTLYALDTELLLEAGATKDEVLGAMAGHIIEKAELIGRYKRVATSTSTAE